MVSVGDHDEDKSSENVGPYSRPTWDKGENRLAYANRALALPPVRGLEPPDVDYM